MQHGDGCNVASQTRELRNVELHPSPFDISLKEDYNSDLPFDMCDDFKRRAESRMQKGYVRDFVGTSLDDNTADNDFAGKLEKLRAAKA